MSHIERHRDGRRIPGGTGRLHRSAAALSALASCAIAHAGIVDINGGTSWNGWTSVGNSRTAGMWVKGSTTRDYNIYSALFTLEEGQTVGGSRVSDGAGGTGTAYTGDTQASLFSGSWKAGDRIVGVGLQYSGAASLATIWVHVDWAGDSIQAASSVGASDGAYGANAGDLSVFSLGGSGNERFRSKQYSVFTGPSDGGSNFITPFGMNATTASPARSFAVLASGSAASATSAQYFINLDAIARSNGGAGNGEGLLGPSTKVGFMEADSSWNLSQQVFSVPTPGAIALIGASLVPLARLRSRRRG
jgi:hypothetical protein